MNRASYALALIGAGAVAGCWQPPRADVRPEGAARVIEQAIAVESVRSGTLQSYDSEARALVLLEPGQAAPQIYPLAPAISVPQMKAGAVVSVRIRQRLTVYVPPLGATGPQAQGVPPTAAAARVLSIDRSYRLLILLYTDGRHETVKMPLHAKLNQMQPGDAVVVQSMQAITVQPGQ